MSVFAAFRHLLPSGKAWRLPYGSTIRKFFEGLAVEPEAVRTAADVALETLTPSLTGELSALEKQFGLIKAPTELLRRQVVDAAWSNVSGQQDPAYLRSELVSNVFDAYVHEWWVPGSTPRTARDPRTVANVPTAGTWTCGNPYATCRADGEVRCDGFHSNVDATGYLVNKSLRGDPPPYHLDDPNTWPYCVYVCGATFGTPCIIAASRRDEFEKLLLSLFPMHLWIILDVDYQGVGVFDLSFDPSFE